mgnify:CR=1 FL=1
MSAATHLPAGFDEAFDPLFGRAFRVARRILGDDAAAEDVAAEAMARAYAHWGKIALQPWREGWVVRVSSNLALDAVRKRSRLSSGVVEASVEDDDVVTVGDCELDITRHRCSTSSRGRFGTPARSR